MKQYKFRGKSELNPKQWHYGNLIQGESGTWIVGDMVEATSDYTINSFWVKVDDSTVGIYTGKRDRNSKKIYDGDILLYQSENGLESQQLIVEWDSKVCSFNFNGYTPSDSLLRRCEVVGNIHDTIITKLVKNTEGVVKLCSLKK